MDQSYRLALECFLKKLWIYFESFLDANNCIKFFNDKFETCDSPSYFLKLIGAEKLNKDRSGAR